ncbi:MAG: hypothetical protein Q7S46_13240 [Gallionella sp.]|nr:hypothetical protein [Gallionella sp.]
MLELNRQTQTSAHRLRYKVFAEEMGASLPSASEGIDRYAKHFLKISEQFLKTPFGKPSLNG